jgi:hypothetical protein
LIREQEILACLTPTELHQFEQALTKIEQHLGLPQTSDLPVNAAPNSAKDRVRA